ncbi:MAG: 50S ribosomal protein L25 [Patescibacteria group bacterium]
MEIKLKAELRDKKEKLGLDFLPGVLYGKNFASQNLKLKKSDFDKVFARAGESNLVDLEIDSKITKVLVKDTQRDIMKNYFIHVDFYKVDMKEKITTEIPLHFIGESKAVKELGGVLIKDLSVLEIECLPGDLIDHIDVDISLLKTFDDAIRINDLHLPPGITLVHHTNEMIAAIRETRIQEEVAPVEAAAAPVAETPAPGSEVKKEASKK